MAGLLGAAPRLEVNLEAIPSRDKLTYFQEFVQNSQKLFSEFPNTYPMSLRVDLTLKEIYKIVDRPMKATPWNPAKVPPYLLVQLLSIHILK